MTAPRPAIVLLSGGMDSATCLAVAQRDGYSVHALSFSYGQRHAVELTAARAIGAAAALHRVITLEPAAFSGSALTDRIAVPKDRATEAMSAGVPVTYVPARNTVFLSYALAWAEVLGARDIFIGVNALDYSGYPDCRPEFIASFQQTARLGTTITDLTVHTPLAHLTKRGIVELGTSLGVDFSLTRTCYDPAVNGDACGHCDACLLRLKGFAEAGLTDPAPYSPVGVS